MYENHWGLARRPFENWGDDAFYYPAEVHQTTMLKLRYGLERRCSAMLVAGDSGMGKSLLLQRLLEQLPEQFAPAIQIAFPQLSGEQLLGYLTDKITGVLGDPSEPLRLTLARLEAFLDKNVAAGHHAVVVIDEAHLLSVGEPLETLRLLLNLGSHRSTGEAAWTLILAGQATLMNLVESNRALDDRVSVKCLLHRFSGEETAGYLQHRLQVAGGRAEQIFRPQAIEALHLRGGGNPRRLNRLADLALMVGFAEELTILDAAHVDGVHQELAGV